MTCIKPASHPLAVIHINSKNISNSNNSSINNSSSNSKSNTNNCNSNNSTSSSSAITFRVCRLSKTRPEYAARSTAARNRGSAGLRACGFRLNIRAWGNLCAWDEDRVSLLREDPRHYIFKNSFWGLLS